MQSSFPNSVRVFLLQVVEVALDVLRHRVGPYLPLQSSRPQIVEVGRGDILHGFAFVHSKRHRVEVVKYYWHRLSRYP